MAKREETEQLRALSKRLAIEKSDGGRDALPKLSPKFKIPTAATILTVLRTICELSCEH